MLLTLAQTHPTTLPATFEISAPMATLISSLLILLGTLVTAILNWRFQNVPARNKVILESYKVAKEAGIATQSDETWARNVLTQIKEDVERHRRRTPYDWAFTLTWVTQFVFFSISGAAFVLKVNDPRFGLAQRTVLFLWCAFSIFGFLLIIRDAWNIFVEYRRHRRGR